MATVTLLTSDIVARDASIFLENNSVMGNLVNRDHEATFAQKIGDTIAVKVPPTQTARDWIDDTSTTDNDLIETSVDLKLSEQPYVAHTLTSAERTMELDDFNEIVTKPAVEAISTAIDSFIIKQAVQAFQVNHVGGEASDPSTVAQLIAGRKELSDNLAPMANRVGVLGTTAEASMLSLDQFTSADYQGDVQAIKEAALGRLYGIDWYVDQNCGDMAQSDTAEVTHMAATEALGVSTITVDDAGGTSSGTVTKGGRFTIAGSTQVYTVTANATASGGAIELPISPALVVEETDGDAITWLTTGLTSATSAKENLIFVRKSVAAAIVAPVALASASSSSAFYKGFGIRVSMSSSTSTLSDQIVFDTYAGCAVIDTNGGCVVGGS